MEERNRTDFAKWMAKQFRLAGEELIRRSEAMDFTGWDAITDISVSFDIATYKDDIEAPSIDISVSCLNKTAIDDLIANSRHFVKKPTEEDALENAIRKDMKICPKCGGDIMQSLTMTDHPGMRVQCCKCGWIHDFGPYDI